MYREHRPLSPALRPLVERIWTRRAAAESTGTVRVLPDGCMDVIFSLGPAPSGEGGSRTGSVDVGGEPAGDSPRPPSYVVGTMTAPLDVRGNAVVDMVGVRFRPGAARAFVDLSASELTDGIVPLDEAWGAGAEETWSRLAAARGTAARVAVVEAALLSALEAGEDRLDREVMAACRSVRVALSPLRVDEVVREAGVGRRQLERRFRAAVGLSPGAAVRVQRFRRALHLLGALPRRSLARVAFEAGYHDQPHFTREFRALAGETPGRWRARSGSHVASVQDAEADAV